MYRAINFVPLQRARGRRHVGSAPAHADLRARRIRFWHRARRGRSNRRGLPSSAIATVRFANEGEMPLAMSRPVVPWGYSRRAPSGKVSATISVSLLTRCLRMQVSVELDIAGGSDDATRCVALHCPRASARSAKAQTSALAQVVFGGQNPSPTFPMDGSAGYARVPSIRPPIVRSARWLHPHNQNKWADAGSAGRAAAKARADKTGLAPGRRGGAGDRKNAVGRYFRHGRNSSSSEGLGSEGSHGKFQANGTA